MDLINMIGYVAWIGDYAMQDCVLVEILYECGAVPFVRTNVPQTLVVRMLTPTPL
jgi:amidase